MLTRLRALTHHLVARRALATSASPGGTQRVVNSNPACCSIPPVHSDYVPKGSYRALAGFDRVYVTGPQSSDTVIVSVYDIFGFFPQTQQGADALAQTLNAAVYMPDFFGAANAASFPIDKFPPSTKEDKDALQAFFAGPADPGRTRDALVRVGRALRGPDGGNVRRLGAYGLCWGAKVGILAASESISMDGTERPVFDAVAALHPAMLSAADADNIPVPLGLFISNDEPVEEYNEMIKKLKQKPFGDKIAYKHYANMFHGWAAARADLKNAENKKEFEDVYSRLGLFFANAFERERGGTATQF